MNNHRLWGARATLALLLCASMAPVLADRPHGNERHREYDTRYSHNRYYPARGVVIDRVPLGHRVVPYRHDRYYFHGGVWYRPYGPRYVVVTPPIGLTISFLPPYYTTLWVGRAPYYYADGVYYAWRPAQRSYVVVEPPRETEVIALPPEVAQQFIYPKNKQSEQQQANDKYECHRWAVTQTGYDPTQPDDTQDATRQNDDYQRATKACLEGRGYSVR